MNHPLAGEGVRARRSSFGRLGAHLRFAARFYLGREAPLSPVAVSGLRVAAAEGYAPELVRKLVALRRAETEDGEVQEINFRCARVALPNEERFYFVKDFARGHALNEVERALGFSRVDRAWRAAHLLPQLGMRTPAPVGRTLAGKRESTEYLVTAWVPEGLSYHLRLRTADPERRPDMLGEFACYLRWWHDSGIYLRDLVTNVLTRESPSGLEYWLTDLDQLHPYRRITRKRLFHQMRQLARWSGPLTEPEAGLIASSYLGTEQGRLTAELRALLLSTPPAEPI